MSICEANFLRNKFFAIKFFRNKGLTYNKTYCTMDTTTEYNDICPLFRAVEIHRIDETRQPLGSIQCVTRKVPT